MSRTLVLLVVMAVAVVGFATALLSVTGTERGSDTASLQMRAASTTSALASLRSAELRGERERLAAVTRRVELQRLVNPSLANRVGPPAIEPGRPPERDARMVVPSESELLDDARAVLQSEASQSGAAVVAVFESTDTNRVVASSITETDLGRVLSQAVRAGLEARSQSGLVWVKDKAWDVSVAPLNEAGTHWLLSGRPVDIKRIGDYGTIFGANVEVTLVNKGITSLSSASDKALAGLINSRASSLRSAEALRAPTPEALAVERVENKDVAFGVVLVSSLDVEQSTTGFLVTVAVEAAAAEGLGQVGNSGPFQNPGQHVPLFLGALVVLGLLIAVGVVLTRAEAGGSNLKPTTAALLTADSLDEVSLSREQQDFVDAVLELSPRPAADAAPEGTRQHQDELDGLREEIELQGSKIKQLQSQIDYARRQVTTAQESAEQAESARKLVSNQAAAARDEASALSERVAQLESESVVQLTPVVEPVIELEAPAPEAKPARKPGDPPVKEYDTAEVSGEEMSQLLDEIDRGEMFAGEEFPSSELPSLDAISAMADHLIDAEPSKKKVTEQTVPRAKMPQAPASETDDPKRTSQLWKVPSKSDHANASISHEGAGRVGRTTLPGGLRVPKEEELKGDDSTAPSHATAPPPWQKGARPARSLSPASLLEALKKRGQPGAADDATGDSTHVSRPSGLLDEAEPERPKTLSQSGVYGLTGSRIDVDPENDTEYFKSLYDEFVDTKRRCGESIEKITLERFINRLARNKKSLMERYGCRTVRFQVYVKDGRAALKATPVK